MMAQQHFHHLLHLLRVNRLLGLQYPGHIPMIGLLELPAKKPMLNGGERQWPRHYTLISRNRLLSFHHFSQLGYRLVLKKMSWSDPQPGLIGLGYNLNTEDRIPT